MSWQTVFRDDLVGMRRSRLGWGVAAVVFVFTGGIGVLVALMELGDPTGNSQDFESVLFAVGVLLSFLVPFVGMLASYSAIVSERQSGSVRFLLGLPNSRLDAYAGKYASRAAVFVLPTAVGLGTLCFLGLLVLEEPALGDFVMFLGVTVLYGLTFVGIGLALSSVLDSETGVTAGLVSVYVVFRGGWMLLQWGLLRVTQPEGQRFRPPNPDWYYVLGRANPMNAYVKLVDSLFNEGNPVPLISSPAPGTETVATGNAFALAVLVVWAAVVPVLGYLRFRDMDVL